MFVSVYVETKDQPGFLKPTSVDWPYIVISQVPPQLEVQTCVYMKHMYTYSHNICICMVHVRINTCVHRYIHVHGETERETERQTEKERERERERTHKQRQSETAEWYTTISYRTSAAHSRIRPMCEAKGKRGSTKAMLRKVTSSSPQITRCLGPTYLPFKP